MYICMYVHTHINLYAAWLSFAWLLGARLAGGVPKTAKIVLLEDKTATAWHRPGSTSQERLEPRQVLHREGMGTA